MFRALARFSTFPKFIQGHGEVKAQIKVIHSEETDQWVSEGRKEQFKKKNKVTFEEDSVKRIIVSEKAANKLKLSEHSKVEFSNKIQQLHNFKGISSNVLASGYSFSRKQKEEEGPNIYYESFKDSDFILEAASSKIRSKEWANTRGDEATTEFFLQECERIGKLGRVEMKVIKGDDLLKEGFRLMHAVGRASDNEPIFVNLSYKGNEKSDEWFSMVGKGVCFDSGGLNLKPTTGIKDMHMDKHGATSTLSAFQSAVRMKLPINFTVSVGLVENFVSSNSYRPLDIIRSRKGLTVEIGNTDAEGRLVLADCMNWTQEMYKVKDMVELSTLTGAIVIALGRKHAGLFSNSNQLCSDLIGAGEEVEEQLWRMPLDEYHHQLVKTKHADVTNSPGKIDAASSQAGAFLEKFVEKGVNWAHLDIAGASKDDSEATGYGARLLLSYLYRSSR